MKSTVEQINPVQCRVNVEISPEEVNVAFDNAYRKIQKKAKIQGFRPGKAPLNVIKKFYAGSVTSEVAETLVNTHLFTALNAETIRPIASPMVETKESPLLDKGFNFSAVVDIMPKIDFDDYKGVPVSAEKYGVKEETVQRELDLLRRRNGKTRAVEAGTIAANGLVAAVSHTAAIDGIDIPQMNVKDMTVFLGGKELYEDLEKQIIGMKIGESKSAVVKLPEQYGDPELAGKDVTFEITLTDLKHMDLPNLDDEFAKDLEFESAEQLQKNVREHIANRAEEMGRQKLEGAVLDKILEMHPFEVPPAMVDQVIDSMIQELQFDSEDQRARALRDQQVRQNFLTSARRRTQNTLILWHVTQKEKLQVTDDEIKSRVDATIQQMGLNDPKQLGKIRKNLEPRVRENMIFEKAMNFLLDNASVTEIPAEL